MLHPQPSPPPSPQMTIATLAPDEGIAVRYQRPSRVNQEKNQELQLKVDELEKLFAAHKLRLSGEEQVIISSATVCQPVDNRLSLARNPLDEIPTRRPRSSLDKRVVENGRSDLVEFDSYPLLRMVDNLEYNMKQSQSESSKGRLYERYMAERVEKLKEQRRLKGIERKLDFEKMEESFALTWAQMMAQFMVLDHSQEEMPSVVSSPARYEKQETRKSFQSLEPMDEQVLYVEDRSSDETLLSDGSLKSISRNLISSKNASSFPSYASVNSSPRHSTNPTSPSQMKQKVNLQDFLAQPLAKSSDSIKENMKPATEINKKTYERMKSNVDSAEPSKEEMVLRPEHIRKHSASFGNLKNLLSIDYDASSTLIEYSDDKSEKRTFNKIHTSAEEKPFSTRGKGISLDAGASVGKRRALKTPEIQIRKVSEDLEKQLLCSPHSLSLETQESERRTKVTGRFSDLHCGSDNKESNSSQESNRYDYIKYENDDIVGSLTQVDIRSAALITEFNAAFEYKERPLEEAPECRNLTTYPSLSLRDEHHEKEVDESVNKGSPAAWRFHTSSKMRESDASRVRKKWGAAQKPVLANPSTEPTMKNVVKGFKMMLTFRRKSKGEESSVNDSVSSTPSEGYSTLEDGDYLAQKPADDPKLRPGKINPWTAPFLLLPQTSD